MDCCKGGWGGCKTFFLKRAIMLESIFILLLVLAVGTVLIAFSKKDPTLLLVGAVLLMGSGLLLLDQSPDAGIEERVGFEIRRIDDVNFDVDFNKSFRNAGNDSSLNILGNLFMWGGAVLLMASLGFLITSNIMPRFSGGRK